MREARSMYRLLMRTAQQFSDSAYRFAFSHYPDDCDPRNFNIYYIFISYIQHEDDQHTCRTAKYPHIVGGFKL